MDSDRTFDLDVVVVGLGYVGLPLAWAVHSAGLSVAGLDVSASNVTSIADGVSYVADVSDADLRSMREGGFFATTESAVLRRARAIIIAVPTPLSDEGGPDLSAVQSAGRMIGAQLQRGQLVSLESTTYPGTTEEVLLPILELASGLVAGTDYHLAFSPERVDPGNTRFSVSNTPKVVGGVNAASTAAAVRLYEAFVAQVLPARGTREAEMAKLLENTYRHINIALINEMARFCHDMGIDVWNVIELAETKPFGFQSFYPGPGVGGHCIPIDPGYLSHRVKATLGYPFRFVELAEEINRSMPRYVVERVQAILNSRGLPLKDSGVLLVGVSYKPDVADVRETPAVDVVRQLRRGGARVSFLDEFVPSFAVDGTPVTKVIEPLDLGHPAIAVVLTDHSAFDSDRLSGVPLVLDTRGGLRGRVLDAELYFL